MAVIRNFPPLADLKLTTAAIMREVGLLARETIVRRTRAGHGSDGRLFQPYSAGYAERKGKELGTTQPNLTVSGEMLNGIQMTRVTDDEVDLGFPR
jgi:hypothetical protein